MVRVAMGTCPWGGSTIPFSLRTDSTLVGSIYIFPIAVHSGRPGVLIRVAGRRRVTVPSTRHFLPAKFFVRQDALHQHGAHSL